jgi:hypothetical protein
MQADSRTPFSPYDQLGAQAEVMHQPRLDLNQRPSGYENEEANVPYQL